MRLKKPVVLLVHGGAGSIRPTKNQLRLLYETLETGWEILKRNGTSLDAVENAIQRLEDSNIFNAGRGGQLQLDGHRRLDASLMEGRFLKAGAVAALEGIANPISAARRVMEKSPHVFLAAKGAEHFSKLHRLKRLGGPREAGLPRPRLRRWAAKLFGTVGAVALDAYGDLAAGASTGGVSVMLPGRVGDSPLIGSGVYADNNGAAVSMTGVGEGIIRAGIAKEISYRVGQGASPRQAARSALRRLITRLRGSAGSIVLDRSGRFVILHTTPYMISGYKDKHGEAIVGQRFSRIR
jgi:beta-aspartyl-peptidase (threonine type)